MIDYKKMTGTNAGFTLIEVMIAVSVSAVLIISVFYAFSHNMDSWRRGESTMGLQSEMSKVMASVYYELKRVNPAVYYDDNFDLWITGEKDKGAKPNVIELIDENNNALDGFERIKFTVYLIEPFSKKEVIEFYLKPDPNSVGNYLKNKKGSAHILIKSIDGAENIISENVESFHISKVASDHRAVIVSAKITMPPEYNLKQKSDLFNLKVRFDNDYIALREVLPAKN